MLGVVALLQHVLQPLPSWVHNDFNMPQCSKCPTKQSKLNVGDLCMSCYKRRKDQKDGETENCDDIAGVSLSAIDAIPDYQ